MFEELGNTASWARYHVPCKLSLKNFRPKTMKRKRAIKCFDNALKLIVNYIEGDNALCQFIKAELLLSYLQERNM